MYYNWPMVEYYTVLMYYNWPMVEYYTVLMYYNWPMVEYYTVLWTISAPKKIDGTVPCINVAPISFMQSYFTIFTPIAPICLSSTYIYTTTTRCILDKTLCFYTCMSLISGPNDLIYEHISNWTSQFLNYRQLNVFLDSLNQLKR